MCRVFSLFQSTLHPLPPRSEIATSIFHHLPSTRRNSGEATGANGNPIGSLKGEGEELESMDPFALRVKLSAAQSRFDHVLENLRLRAALKILLLPQSASDALGQICSPQGLNA